MQQKKEKKEIIHFFVNEVDLNYAGCRVTSALTSTVVNGAPNQFHQIEGGENDSHTRRDRNGSIAVDDLGALVLDPLEPSPQRSLHPALHGVRLVPGDPLLPLHLRVREPPRLRGRRRRSGAASSPSVTRPALPSRDHRRRRMVVLGGRVRPVARAEPLPAHDLHPPVAAVGSEPVHEPESGATASPRYRKPS